MSAEVFHKESDSWEMSINQKLGTVPVGGVLKIVHRAVYNVTFKLRHADGIEYELEISNIKGANMQWSEGRKG